MSLPYVDLAEELPDAPEDLVRFVAKATAQNPEDRYLDCKSIVDVLQSQKQGGTLLKDAGVQSILPYAHRHMNPKRANSLTN